MKTDQELKQLFLKLLPGKVTWYQNPSTGVSTLLWNHNDPRFVEAVKDTELLSLCMMVEETFTQAEKVDYLNALRAILAKEHNRAISDFDLLHASWQQRIQAVAKVKGLT